MTKNEVPRRNRLDLNTPAELAIRNAQHEVEKAGADVRLTECIILLDMAFQQCADFNDNIPFKRKMEFIVDKEPLLKLTVFKKIENAGTNKGKEHYFFCMRGSLAKNAIEVELPSEKEYKEAIELYKMVNVPSVFDECYESHYV